MKNVSKILEQKDIVRNKSKCIKNVKTVLFIIETINNCVYVKCFLTKDTKQKPLSMSSYGSYAKYD